jgi:hypothetical protein
MHQYSYLLWRIVRLPSLASRSLEDSAQGRLVVSPEVGGESPGSYSVYRIIDEKGAGPADNVKHLSTFSMTIRFSTYFITVGWRVWTKAGLTTSLRFKAVDGRANAGGISS